MKEPGSEHAEGGGVALWDSMPKGVASAVFHMNLRGDRTNIWKSTRYN